MKNFILVVLVVSLFNMSLNACEGDCVVCHPKLVKEDGKLDKDHAILVTCKTCHTQEEMEKIDMGSGCGQDCWDCHDIKKVTASNVAEHKGLQKCIDCHVTIDKSMFGGETVSAFSQIPTLDSLVSSSTASVADKSVDQNVATMTKELNKTTTNEIKELSILEKVQKFFKELW
jgi:hypothetical protein